MNETGNHEDKTTLMVLMEHFLAIHTEHFATVNGKAAEYIGNLVRCIDIASSNE
jgi:hypothetical protein